MPKIFKLPVEFDVNENKRKKKVVFLTHEQIAKTRMNDNKEVSTTSKESLMNWVDCLSIIAHQNKLNIVFLPIGLVGDSRDIREMQDLLMLSIYLN